jgi:hypothetical protein
LCNSLRYKKFPTKRKIIDIANLKMFVELKRIKVPVQMQASPMVVSWV